MKKENKGITLVALVVTIIILLILVGISISSLKENGLFTKAILASEASKKAEGEELLKTKVYEYQIQAISRREEVTLEWLKEYLKDDTEIEYIDLYNGTDENLNPIQQGEKATHAKVKLKKYKYEYILNQRLEVAKGNKLDESEENSGKVYIDSELERLLKEANMTITLEDILNTPAIMNQIEGLIPKLTESDVIRSEQDGSIIYKDSTGGTIRSNSEEIDNEYYLWKAFDRDTNTPMYSDKEKAKDYYIEYEFPQEVYALKIKYIFTNGSTFEGTRNILIQGYNEINDIWENISEELEWKGNQSTNKEDSEILDYVKAYKGYRLFVNNATYVSNSNGMLYSGLYEMQLYGVQSSEVETN